MLNYLFKNQSKSMDDLLDVYNFKVHFEYEGDRSYIMQKITFFENDFFSQKIVFYTQYHSKNNEYYIQNKQQKDFLDKLLSYHKLQINLKEKENNKGVKKL